MKSWLQTLVAAVAGGAAVWVAFWLLESVLPEVINVPREAGLLTVLLALLAAGGFLVRGGQLVEAAALLTGSGAAWAVHEVQPFGLCQSDLLYRPCTVSEIGLMVVPPVVLIVCAAVVATLAHRRRLHALEQAAA
jgi:hypothetical protein